MSHFIALFRSLFVWEVWLAVLLAVLIVFVLTRFVTLDDYWLAAVSAACGVLCAAMLISRRWRN